MPASLGGWAVRVISELSDKRQITPHLSVFQYLTGLRGLQV